MKEGEDLQQEQFTRVISEVVDYAIILINPDGIITSWNKGAEKIKGYTSAEILGKNFKIFHTEEDIRDGLPDLLIHEACTQGRAYHEGWHQRKNGSRFWGSIALTALRNETGNIAGYVKVTRDLTDKKIAEDKLGNIIEELRQKNEELKQSEEKYHKMISEIQDYAIILLDPEGIILEWNKGAEKLKGYTAKEIIGKSFRLFYTSEDKHSGLPQKLLQEAKAKGFVSQEGYRIRKNGTRFWGNVAITALHDEKGGVIGYSKVTKDLTDRKAADDKIAMTTLELRQMNEELRQSEERYYKMISEVQDYAILLLNSEGIIQNWNTGAEFIKGYKASEIIGKNFRQFYTAEDKASHLPERLLKEAEKKGKATSEGWRVKKDGSRFWAYIVITALHNKEGEVIGYSKVTRDLTEKKKAEDALRLSAAELEQQNAELEALNDELSSFAYVVSHDLKEPIRKIQVFAGRQLEPDKSREQILEFSQKIITSAARMQKLMEALISYSHISVEANGFEKINLNDIVEAVKTDLEVPIANTQTRIKMGKLPDIKGIPFQIHQMFLNLLANAIKFARENSKPEITIDAYIPANGDLPEELAGKNKKYHLITVSDKGIGFEPEYAEKIFEVFQRLKPKNQGTGTGIGLSIVKKVVQNHGGIIEAEGNPDHGASFRIYLPA